MRPRSLTAMPLPVAHARMSPLRSPVNEVRTGRRRWPRAALRAWLTKGATLSRAFQLSRGRVDIEVQDVLANGRHAVALFRSRAERKGRRLDAFDAVIFRVEGGKFAEVWHRSEDPYASDVFWS